MPKDNTKPADTDDRVDESRFENKEIFDPFEELFKIEKPGDDFGFGDSTGYDFSRLCGATKSASAVSLSGLSNHYRQPVAAEFSPPPRQHVWFRESGGGGIR